MGNDNSTSNRISRRDLVKGVAAGAGAAALLGPLDIARAAGRPASSGVTVTLATNASFQTYKGLHGGPLYTELVAELKRQTGIILNVVFIPENLLYNKVQLDIVGGARRYDMMETGAGGAKQFGMAGRLLALPRPKDIGDFFPGDIQQYSLGSKLYGYPKITDTNLYYWRIDLVKKAGFDAMRPPATLAEARARAIALTVDANGRHPNDPKFDRGRVVVYGDNYKGTAGLANTGLVAPYATIIEAALPHVDYLPRHRRGAIASALMAVLPQANRKSVPVPCTLSAAPAYGTLVSHPARVLAPLARHAPPAPPMTRYDEIGEGIIMDQNPDTTSPCANSATCSPGSPRQARPVAPRRRRPRPDPPRLCLIKRDQGHRTDHVVEAKGMHTRLTTAYRALDGWIFVGAWMRYYHSPTLRQAARLLSCTDVPNGGRGAP